MTSLDLVEAVPRRAYGAAFRKAWTWRADDQRRALQPRLEKDEITTPLDLKLNHYRLLPPHWRLARRALKYLCRHN